jgi:hypothetical protein
VKASPNYALQRSGARVARTPAAERELYIRAGGEDRDLLDSHRLHDACRSRTDRPCRKPRPARREHHRTDGRDDGDECQGARDADVCSPKGQTDRGSLDPRRPISYARTQGIGGGRAAAAVVVRTGAELEGAFAAMARARAQALQVLGTGPYIAEKKRIAELAIRYRLPTFFNLRDHVEAGGLMSYGPDFSDLVRRGAIYVDKILRGARPADLPVERAAKFELVINMKTAKTLGLTIPPSLLLQADQVIER